MLEEGNLVALNRRVPLDHLNCTQGHDHVGSEVFAGSRGRRVDEAFIVGRVVLKASMDEDENESTEDEEMHAGGEEVIKTSQGLYNTKFHLGRARFKQLGDQPGEPRIPGSQQRRLSVTLRPVNGGAP